jgi:hypothetical protein
MEGLDVPLIREAILTTMDRSGRIQIAPLGLIADGSHWIIAPFRPSLTLDNLEQVPFAAASHTDDVRVFAGCLTGRRDWPLAPSENIAVPRLHDALSHWELEVVERLDDELRPRFRCRLLAAVTHAPFPGYTRAKYAVIEAAILSSRLHLLPREKVETEIAYLQIAVSKTASPEDVEAWEWLMEKIRGYYRGQ